MTGHELLDEHIEALLNNPDYAGHPLGECLGELYRRYREQGRQIDRIAYIADRFQAVERSYRLDSAARVQRQLRQIEKVMRISDRYQYMLRDVNERLAWISNSDELTGIPNRRRMQAQLQRELRHTQEHGGEFCVALADLDYFKTINDSYGHEVGDKALMAVAQCLTDNIREHDLCGRWGGEEFLLIFPGADLATTRAILERLHEAMAVLSSPLLPERPLLSVSFGLTACRDGQEPFGAILKRVDGALYQAKHEGRRRTVVV